MRKNQKAKKQNRLADPHVIRYEGRSLSRGYMGCGRKPNAGKNYYLQKSVNVDGKKPGDVFPLIGALKERRVPAASGKSAVSGISTQRPSRMVVWGRREKS